MALTYYYRVSLQPSQLVNADVKRTAPPQSACKGFGFAEFESTALAQSAITRLNGLDFKVCFLFFVFCFFSWT
jgi:hypothetical protein